MTEGNKYLWKVITRDKISLENNQILKVCGPFRDNMQLELAEKEDLNDPEYKEITKTGTRIEITTSFEFFSTTYKRGKVFTTLIDRFIEHVSVLYKAYLRGQFSTIEIRWKDSTDLSSTWESHIAKPIEIYYDADGSNVYDLLIAGDQGDVQVKYTAGKLDKDKTCEAEDNRPYPLKIYYQGNQTTQGIDLVVRGRVVKSGILTDIWGIVRHNNMNAFVGELLIEDKRVKTINNKLGLDPNNIYTVNLIDELRSEEKYKIERITNKQSEATVKSKFKKYLKGIYREGIVSPEHPIWSGSGVQIDMYTKNRHDEIELYEFKTTVAKPLDVYQLLMYWDGVVKDENKSPYRAILVASEIPDKIHLMIKDINNRKDALETKYNLDTDTISNMGLTN